MRRHIYFHIATLLVVTTCSDSASAASVTFILDLTGAPGTFTLSASASLGDNGGISSYGIPLTGPITSLNHRSPYAISASTFAPTGFSNLLLRRRRSLCIRRPASYRSG